MPPNMAIFSFTRNTPSSLIEMRPVSVPVPHLNGRMRRLRISEEKKKLMMKVATKPDHAIDQPRAQLNQVIKQRGFRGVNIFLRHGFGASSGAPKYLSKSLLLLEEAEPISFLSAVIGLPTLSA